MLPIALLSVLLLCCVIKDMIFSQTLVGSNQTQTAFLFLLTF